MSDEQNKINDGELLSIQCRIWDSAVLLVDHVRGRMPADSSDSVSIECVHARRLSNAVGEMQALVSRRGSKLPWQPSPAPVPAEVVRALRVARKDLFAIDHDKSLREPGEEIGTLDSIRRSLAQVDAALASLGGGK